MSFEAQDILDVVLVKLNIEFVPTKSFYKLDGAISYGPVLNYLAPYSTEYDQ